MKDVFAAMAQAKQAIIFLVFQPGSPSIVEYAAACENAKPGLLIYGAATDPNASEDYKTLLIHRTTKDTEIVRDDTDVVSASGVATQFAYWQKELLKLPNAHAIIHDKILVIDPMSSDCVVITGSHNQGFRASYANDENFIMVRGHQPLAQAYATHVMDVYDHYRWRFTLKTTSIKNAFSGLDPTARRLFRRDRLHRHCRRRRVGQGRPSGKTSTTRPTASLGVSLCYGRGNCRSWWPSELGASFPSSYQLTFWLPSARSRSRKRR
jgi:hypothetical protein